jgi:hypothetical protein
LPLYSWYPRTIKKYCERLAMTTHAGIANYAKRPAGYQLVFFLRTPKGSCGKLCIGLTLSTFEKKVASSARL